MLDYLIAALTLQNLLFAVAGVAAGAIIGAIPGLTATMAVAVLAPITFAMPTDSALILLGAIYTGAIYGGAYAAILLNTPGTPSAIATTFDGFPMAKRGDGDLAVSVACLASVVGGLVGALALLWLSPPLADAALAFGPTEYFWLAIFGLSLIAALSTGDPFKSAIAGCFGLLLAMIGVSETSGEVRFTFGSQTLIGGIEIVSALIGLYCVPVLMDLAATPERHLDAPKTQRGFRLPEAFGVMLRNKLNMLRGSVIGTLVGALPGAGGSIASLVAYSEARRGGAKQDDPKYGEGNPGGIVATESANNAVVGGGFIPTLVLGIPGTPPDAVILGALLVQGVRTGPTLFSDGAGTVYTFIFGLLIATVMMLPVGLMIGRFAYRTIVKAPKAALAPIVAFMTIIGAYAIRNSLSDVFIMIVLGLVGWFATRRGFSVSPIVLGLILGRIAEQGFVQSWTIGDATGNLFGQFFGRPISLAIVAMIAISLLYPAWPTLKRLFARQATSKADAAPRGSRTGALLDFAVFGLIGAIAIDETLRLNDDAAVFPQTIAILMCVVVALALVKTVVFGARAESKPTGSTPRRFAVPALMLGGLALIPILGFGAAGLAVGLALIVPARHGPADRRAWFGLAAAVAAAVVGMTVAFREFLSVPLPAGALF